MRLFLIKVATKLGFISDPFADGVETVEKLVRRYPKPEEDVVRLKEEVQSLHKKVDADIKELREQNLKLAEALSFYANANYCPLYAASDSNHVLVDRGERAMVALLGAESVNRESETKLK